MRISRITALNANWYKEKELAPNIGFQAPKVIYENKGKDLKRDGVSHDVSMRHYPNPLILIMGISLLPVLC